MEFVAPNSAKSRSAVRRSRWPPTTSHATEAASPRFREELGPLENWIVFLLKLTTILREMFHEWCFLMFTDTWYHWYRYLEIRFILMFLEVFLCLVAVTKKGYRNSWVASQSFLMQNTWWLSQPAQKRECFSDRCLFPTAQNPKCLSHLSMEIRH